MKRINGRGILVGAILLGLTGMLSAGAQTRPPGRGGGGAGDGTPPPPRDGSGFGAHLQGLDPTRRAQFDEGRREFTRRWRPDQGLGPVFNGQSCVECHDGPAAGGSGRNLAATRVTRFGRWTGGSFDPLEHLGGTLIQRRSLREFSRAYPIPGETVPLEANVRAFRAASPMFGAGLLEAIPAAEILARADPDDADRDGVSGRPNRVQNHETGARELGRFGWKAQVPTLSFFAGDALVNELSVTSPSFPLEILPQGRSIPAGADRVPDPEANAQEVAALAAFMRYLAPPPAGTPTPAATRGRAVFVAIGCAACHTPQMRTEGSDPGVAGRTVNLYSDLLLHDMGPALADGIPMGEAGPAEWRTTPLWGVAARPNWLHDGRAGTIDQAIRLHGGESAASATRYQGLNPGDRDALNQFLRSL